MYLIFEAISYTYESQKAQKINYLFNKFHGFLHTSAVLHR